MGKKWDSDKGGRKQWVNWLCCIMKECKRVIKPGGHILVWALPRKSHWTALAIEDAGFEIRDIINHLFGTGFPKSLDISKAIDKEKGMERKKVKFLISKYSTAGKGSSNEIDNNPRPWLIKAREKGYHITYGNEALSNEAKQHSGYGTNLKPAVEHWILARKPISESTIAKNVLKWGTGGLNIDGCRIPISMKDALSMERCNSPKSARHHSVKATNGKFGRPSPTGNLDCFQGRWPANVTLNEDVAKLLDEQIGISKSVGASKHKGHSVYEWSKSNPLGTKEGQYGKEIGKGDKGGPSRFFYVAKASRKERELGLNGFDKKKRAPHRKDGKPGGDNPRNRGVKRVRNVHPTTKPVSLMKWLCRLVTPKNGTVLDPFMGSGSTGVACILESFDFIDIEKEKEYFDIAEARINYAKNNPEAFAFLDKRKTKKKNQNKQIERGLFND